MRIGDTLGDNLAAALAQPARSYTIDDGGYCSALELARQLAPLFGESEGVIFASLETVPNPMLDYLASPDGWSALASFIAADFGLAVNSYKPTIH